MYKWNKTGRKTGRLSLYKQQKEKNLKTWQTQWHTRWETFYTSKKKSGEVKENYEIRTETLTAKKLDKESEERSMEQVKTKLAKIKKTKRTPGTKKWTEYMREMMQLKNSVKDERIENEKKYYSSTSRMLKRTFISSFCSVLPLPLTLLSSFQFIFSYSYFKTSFLLLFSLYFFLLSLLFTSLLRLCFSIFSFFSTENFWFLSLRNNWKKNT